MTHPRFYRRRWFVVLVCIVVAVGLVWAWVSACKWWHRRTILARYQGHRYLIWVFDSKTHEVKGFSDGVVRPGDSARFDPAPGVRFDVELGRISPQQTSDFETGQVVEEYDVIHYSLRYGTGEGDYDRRQNRTEGGLNLTRPCWSVHSGVVPGRDAVEINVPLGTEGLDPGSIALPEKLSGTAEDLEDLLLANVPRWKRFFWGSGWAVISTYLAIGPTQRAAQWLDVLHDDDSHFQSEAAAVLMLAGNREGTEFFYRTASPSLLAWMPPSGPVLKRIVHLIVQEGPLPAHDPFWAPRGRDLRKELIRTITTKYSKDDVRPYAPQLLQWAENRDEPWAGDLKRFVTE